MACFKSYQGLQLNAPRQTESFGYISALLGEAWVEKALDDHHLFRQFWSPESRWYHRLPHVSPVVPLLYWNSRASLDEFDEPHQLQEPMGFWAGHPREVLNRLTEQIRYFEDYWRGLPNGRGTRNLAWALRSPQRLFSLAHELATAFFFATRDGVWVEPLFLDPQSSAGKPDFLAHTAEQRFAVQCKSHDPTAARQFPYDLWQYLAGVVHRVILDSGRSIHFNVNLSGKMDRERVQEVAERVCSLVHAGIRTPYPWRSEAGEFRLVELGVFPEAGQLTQLRLEAFSSGAPLYDELIAFPSRVDDRFRCASLTVVGREGEDVTEAVRRAVISATKSAVTPDPLIVAVHLYQAIDFDQFPQRPLVRKRLLPWSNGFFANNPQLAMIHLSSNFESYLFRPIGDMVGMRHGRAGWVMESPLWDHSNLAVLGM